MSGLALVFFGDAAVWVAWAAASLAVVLSGPRLRRWIGAATRRRSDPDREVGDGESDHLLVRGVQLALLASLAWVAFDRLVEGPTRIEAPQRIVATTGGADGPWLAALQQAAVRGHGSVQVFAGDAAGFSTARAAARLAARRDEDVALVWTGGWLEQRAAIEAGRRPGGLAPDRGSAFQAGRPLGFEPDRLRLRLGGRRPRVGRPTVLELLAVGATGLEELPDDLGLAVEVDGTRHSWGAADRLAGARGFVVPWTPERSGVVDLRLELTLAGEDRPVATATGRLEVEPASAGSGPVAVVGAGAESFVAALAAQGLDATPYPEASQLAEALRGAPPGSGTVIALSELEPALQELLVERVGDGDGLVLVGNALPRAGEPLQEVSPFEPRQEVPAQPGGSGDLAAPPRPEDRGGPDADPSPVDPEGPPPPPENTDRPEPDPDRPLVGDTSGADTGQIEHAEVERRRVTLVLVIDRSGSMAEASGPLGGPSKMQLVKTSAFRIAEGLEPDDQLGVIAFHHSPSTIVPLGRRLGREGLRARLEGIRSDGLTKVGHALRAAEEMLRGTDLPVRHVVLLTDGEELDATDVRVSQAAARRLAEAGATVSVIHVATSRLTGEVAEIASFGRGKYLKTEDGRAIPRLMFAEVRRVLGAAGRRFAGDDPEAMPGGAGDGAQPGGSDPVDQAPTSPDPDPAAADRTPDDPHDPPDPLPEPPPDRQLPDPGPDPGESAAPLPAVPVFPVEVSPLVEPWAEEGFPPVRGGTLPGTRSRRSSLILLATPVGEPVLGVASRGLGRVAGFAVPIGGPETEEWLEDPRYPAWWATWIEAVRPTLAPAVAGADELADPFVLSADVVRPAELAELERLGGGEVRPVGELVVGAPRTVRDAPRPAAADDARWALLGLLILAGVERLLRGGASWRRAG